MRVLLFSISICILLSGCIREGTYLYYVISGINEKDVVSIITESSEVRNDSVSISLCTLWLNRRAKPKPIRLAKFYLENSEGYCDQQKFHVDELANAFTIQIGKRQIEEKVYMVKPLKLEFSKGNDVNDSLYTFRWEPDSLASMRFDIRWWPQSDSNYVKWHIEVEDNGYFALTKEHLKGYTNGHGEISVTRKSEIKLNDRKYDAWFSSSCTIEGPTIEISE